MKDNLERCIALGTAVLSDVLDEAGYHSQTLDPQLAFIGKSTKMCGPAVCAMGERSVVTATTRANDVTLPLYNLPTLSAPDAVLVLATSGFRGGAVTGELLARELNELGAAGLLTDGLVRDCEALRTLGLPIKAAGTIPLNGARRFTLSQWEKPVLLPGPEGATVAIAPGDIVAADADGAVIIPAQVFEDVLDMAEELARREVVLKRQADDLSPSGRARARSDRMSHMVWLRKSMAKSHEV